MNSAHVYPKAFELPVVKCDLSLFGEVEGGGFGAIYKGTLGGRAVCVKAVRITQRDYKKNKANLRVSLSRSPLLINFVLI
jgi:hypothetical protein